MYIKDEELHPISSLIKDVPEIITRGNMDIKIANENCEVVVNYLRENMINSLYLRNN